MLTHNQEGLLNLLKENPRSTVKEGDEVVYYPYRYGTAGFRCDATKLDSVMVRVGLLAALRSQMHNGEATGVMITASHNAEKDNGVKIIDPTGEMLHESWENFATTTVNLPEEEVIPMLMEYQKENKIDASITARVFIGRDTRSHSERFSNLLTQAVNLVGGVVSNFGQTITPQVHQMVRFSHHGVSEPNLEMYYKEVCESFLKLTINTAGVTHQFGEIYVDCANGVGAIPMEIINNRLQDKIQISLINTIGSGPVNQNCGAEHVQKKKVFPENFSREFCKDGRKCCSIDGDCDRLVYFTADNQSNFQLMDGDKIIALYAGWILSLLEKSGLGDVSFGIIQTAYANGASTKYMTDVLQAEVQFAKTGVKYCHKKAHQYEVSVYFEANGHGTLVYSHDFHNKLQEKLNSSGLTEDEKTTCESLVAVAKLANQCVGDALTDMLLCELALAAQKFSVMDWSMLYKDFPSRMTKVKVKDRSVFETTNAERTCLKPEGIQDAIDQLMPNYPNGRAFVRPSGTEDVVRVYSEAETQEEADKLNVSVQCIVFDLADGVGSRPESEGTN